MALQYGYPKTRKRLFWYDTVMNKSLELSDHHFIRNVLLEEGIDSDAYPFNIPSVSKLEDINFDRAVTFLVGENGSGKSTIIEAIATAAGFNSEGGSKNMNFSTRDTTSSLSKKIRLVQGITKPRTGYFLRAESFYNVASNIESLDASGGGALIGANYGNVPLHHQSHGESFLALINNRFGPNGLYILDEPEAALSPERQLSLLIRIKQLVVEGSQFIIATHSPVLLACPEATIYELSKDGVAKTDYEETRHYNFMLDFLSNHQAYTRRLTGE